MGTKKIVIKSKRSQRENILKRYPNAIIFDVTSKGAMKTLSPFYPHGGIPVPGMEGVTSASVEGVWQGLKVFESKGIDRKCFKNVTMMNLKRSCRVNGKVLGHKYGKELLDYIEARKKIYVPTYYYMLEHFCSNSIATIAKLAEERTVVLLDYDINEDIDDPKRPLSHASLIKRYILEHFGDENGNE